MELIQKPTSAGEAWMNSASATNANLQFLLKAAIQELKTNKQISGQIDDMRQEIIQIREATQQDATRSYVENTLEAFRTEIRESIKELKTQNSKEELPQSYAMASKGSAPKPIYVAIRQAEEEQKVLSAVKKEEKEREKRSLNIRIRGLEESENDAETFKDVCRQLGVTAKVKSLTRIDRKPRLKESLTRKSNTEATDNTLQQPKHLVVTLETTKNRAELLRASQKLKGTSYDKVYIDPDYTPVEAKELFDLRVECRRRNESISSPNDRWVVFRRQIIQRKELPPKDL